MYVKQILPNKFYIDFNNKFRLHKIYFGGSSGETRGLTEITSTSRVHSK
jgi:hypothetical protein